MSPLEQQRRHVQKGVTRRRLPAKRPSEPTPKAVDLASFKDQTQFAKKVLDDDTGRRLQCLSN